MILINGIHFLFNLLEEENIYPPKLTGQWITDKKIDFMKSLYV